MIPFLAPLLLVNCPYIHFDFYNLHNNTTRKVKRSQTFDNTMVNKKVKRAKLNVDQIK